MSPWERQFAFTMSLSIQMYKWETVITIPGRGAIINLSSGRYETLGLVTTQFTISPTASILFVLRIIASNNGNWSIPAILQLGFQKKFKFVSAPNVVFPKLSKQ